MNEDLKNSRSIVSECTDVLKKARKDARLIGDPCLVDRANHLLDKAERFSALEDGGGASISLGIPFVEALSEETDALVSAVNSAKARFCRRVLGRFLRHQK